MFSYLDNIGLSTPLHGSVEHLYPRILDRVFPHDPSMRSLYAKQVAMVVVYTDPMAHCGEGKQLMPLADALDQYPNHYASEYVPSQKSGCGLSLRYLRVGTRFFWLRYSSDDWRSNCGTVQIDVISELNPLLISDQVASLHPIFAIDFVPGGKLFAVDFNIAPGLRGTGLENLIAPKDVYNEIENWFENSFKS